MINDLSSSLSLYIQAVMVTELLKIGSTALVKSSSQLFGSSTPPVFITRAWLVATSQIVVHLANSFRALGSGAVAA